MQLKLFFYTLGCVMLTLPVAIYASDDLKAWPAAEKGYVRKVIRLEPLENETNHRVEIVAGKEMLIDCNRYHFEGALQKRTDIGWGYPSYWLDKPFGPLHTMMGCIDYPKRKAFVPVSSMIGNNTLISYNSKLPIVVYVPEGFGLRYRVWSSTNDYIYAESE